MGYSTDFRGVLKFKTELTASQIALLSNLLGKDRRDIGFDDDNEVYSSKDEYWYHINLKLTEDFSGIEWNGSEKTYDLEHIVNFVTRLMKQKYKDFELIGQLSAQGEDADDRWVLVMENGIAKKKDLKTILKEYICPKCEEKIKKVFCSECEEEILIGDLK